MLVFSGVWEDLLLEDDLFAFFNTMDPDTIWGIVLVFFQTFFLFGKSKEFQGSFLCQL